jgi:hypothetical protein
MTMTTTGIGTIPASAQITALQQVREYPTISLLLSTKPRPPRSPAADALRLDALAAEAVQRLRSELRPAAAAPAIGRLQTLIDQAHRGPAGHGLAVYASAGSQALIRLPMGVRDRAVVGPTFATRDLIRALHRTPRHLVLTLNAGHARLLGAAADTLLPAATSAFPMSAGRRTATGRASRGRADRPTREAPPWISTVRSTPPSAPTCACTPPRWCSSATSAPPPPSAVYRPTASGWPAPSPATWPPPCRPS